MSILTCSTILAHTDPIFISLKLVPLPKVAIHGELVFFMNKLISNSIHAAMNYLIDQNNYIHQYNTRQNSNCMTCDVHVN